jgi:hypothetical protein
MSACKDGSRRCDGIGRQRQYTRLECELIEGVKSSLQYELFSNASFLCERLYAEIVNEEIKLLLAQCYLGTSSLTPSGENKPYKAYYVLKDPVAMPNRYKFALVCIQLQKYAEAEKALLGRGLGEGGDERPIACGAAGYYLLGLICEKQARYYTVPSIDTRTRCCSTRAHWNRTRRCGWPSRRSASWRAM